MDLKLIQRLVRMMEKAELTELEIDDSSSGTRVHLKRGGEGPLQAAPMVQYASGPASSAALGGGGVELPAGEPAAAAAGGQEGTPFLSPMVGTFYRSPSPDSDPFVSEGVAIDEETVICIIEAMKVMNEIKAETRGVIAKILVENGEPIEFGQPLFLLRPA